MIGTCLLGKRTINKEKTIIIHINKYDYLIKMIINNKIQRKHQVKDIMTGPLQEGGCPLLDVS